MHVDGATTISALIELHQRTAFTADAIARCKKRATQQDQQDGGGRRIEVDRRRSAATAAAIEFSNINVVFPMSKRSAAEPNTRICLHDCRIDSSRDLAPQLVDVESAGAP